MVRARSKRPPSALALCALCGICLSSVIGCGGTPARDTAATPRPLSEAEKAQRAEQMRKAERDARAAQIDRSNLPPGEKQRLLNQGRASGGR